MPEYVAPWRMYDEMRWDGLTLRWPNDRRRVIETFGAVA